MLFVTMSLLSFHLIDMSTTASIILALVIGLVAYTLYGAIWRLFLSPIAHIPGPRFAALTFWNEFYYDVYLGGKYTWKLREYHETYGMRKPNLPHGGEKGLSSRRSCYSNKSI